MPSTFRQRHAENEILLLKTEGRINENMVEEVHETKALTIFDTYASLQWGIKFIWQYP